MQSNMINGQMFSDIIPNQDSVAAKDSIITTSRNIRTSRVLIIGLGQLGLPVAKYVKERGFDTYGYDIEQKALERAEKVASIKRADSLSEFDFDVYIICVSTHKPNDIFVPQIDGLLHIVEEISRKAKDGAIVSIESTIPRGTSKKVFEMLNHRLHVVHVPHRWYALEEIEHGVNQLRVIGGVHDCCLRSALQFYTGEVGGSSKNDYSRDGTGGTSNSGISGNNISGNDNRNRNLGIPLHPVSDIDIAEVTKVAENAYRYLQIAFAEDLYLYCKGNSLSFPELREAINTKWNVNILEPRDGIGGHCLPKDTRMFLQSSKSIRSKILTAALEVDQDYRRHRQSSRVELQVLCRDIAKSDKIKV
jgi:UDP-N-acetyl-D-mannosaminuronic acid dehydrogenase